MNNPRLLATRQSNYFDLHIDNKTCDIDQLHTVDFLDFIDTFSLIEIRDFRNINKCSLNYNYSLKKFILTVSCNKQSSLKRFDKFY